MSTPNIASRDISVGHRPAGRWEFDASVVACFDDMLARSIPAFDEMRRVVIEVGRHFITPGSTVVDLGCSRGGSLAPFVADQIAGRFVGVEVSEAMRAEAEARFKADPAVEITNVDLRDSYPDDIARLTLSVLTIQFTPIEYRQRLLRNIYEHTEPGGAFVIVEKCLGETPIGGDLLAELYRKRKATAGYSDDDIETKRRSLEGVLVPITPAWNEAALRAVGFTVVEPIWRVLNFAAWVAIRP